MIRLRRLLPSDAIPTVSLADIAFLLVVFFLVTNLFAATRGLDFGLPASDERAIVVDRAGAVVVAILPGGALEFDGEPMPPERLADALRPKLAANPTMPVILRPDPDATYGEMIAIYDLLRGSAGVAAETIAIPTQREIDQFWN